VDRNELTIAIAAALLGAVVLGWLLHWIFAGMNRAAGPRSIKRTAEMATRLHAAEEAQQAAERRLAQVETDLNQRIGEMQAELDTANQSLAQSRRQAEDIRAAYRAAMSEKAQGG
jgi:hypothetical protein